MIAAYFFTSPSKLIFPSWIRTTRFASRAMELSWVIMTIVFPSSLSFFKKSSTSRPVLESRAPVGCVKLVQNKEPQQGCCLPGFCYSPILSGTSSSVTVLSLAISFNGKNGHFLYVSYLSPSLHMKQFDRTQFLFANSAAASLFIIQCPIPPGKPTTCRECLFTFCLQIPVSLSGGQHRTAFLLLLLL